MWVGENACRRGRNRIGRRDEMLTMVKTRNTREEKGKEGRRGASCAIGTNRIELITIVRSNDNYLPVAKQEKGRERSERGFLCFNDGAKRKRGHCTISSFTFSSFSYSVFYLKFDNAFS